MKEGKCFPCRGLLFVSVHNRNVCMCVLLPPLPNTQSRPGSPSPDAFCNCAGPHIAAISRRLTVVAVSASHDTETKQDRAALFAPLHVCRRACGNTLLSATAKGRRHPTTPVHKEHTLLFIYFQCCIQSFKLGMTAHYAAQNHHKRVAVLFEE